MVAKSSEERQSQDDKLDGGIKAETEERKKEQVTEDARPKKRKSTLEKLHLGFIARLIGRGGDADTEDEEENATKLGKLRDAAAADQENDGGAALDFLRRSHRTEKTYKGKKTRSKQRHS